MVPRVVFMKRGGWEKSGEREGLLIFLINMRWEPVILALATLVQNKQNNMLGEGPVHTGAFGAWCCALFFCGNPFLRKGEAIK